MNLIQQGTTILLKSGEILPIPKCRCEENLSRYIYYSDIDDIIWLDCMECIEEDRAIAIKEKKKLIIRDLSKTLKKMGVSKLHYDASLSDLDNNNWVSDIDRSLYIFGDPGRGKTYAAVALLREQLLRGRKAEIITMTDLLYRIRKSYNKISEETQDGIIEHFTTIKHLVIDDIGREQITNWAGPTIYQIIDQRYREELHTIFTSNLSLKELSLHLDERITSRIGGWCKVIHMKGEDRRLTERPQREDW